MNASFLPAAGWAVTMFVAMHASAQVRPPGATDLDGDDYLYPVLIRKGPVVRVPSTVKQPDLDTNPPLLRRDFFVTPDRIGGVLDLSASVVWKETLLENLVCPRSSDVRIWLSARGVTFPPGAAVSYLPGSHRLIVRNTPANLDLIASLMPPTPPPTRP